MTQETDMPLDERGLEAALKVFEADHGENSEAYLSAAIRAYLQTAAADVSGLVAELAEHIQWNREYEFLTTVEICEKAASTLQTLSASNAALEAENERLRVALKQTEYLMTKDSFSAAERLSEGLAHVRQARAALSAPKGGQDHG